MSQKRGQITVFIVIGIIILLATAIVLFYRARVVEVRPKIIPKPELSPVEAYVVACLDQLGEEGAVLLGAQAGFIEMPAQIAGNPASYVIEDRLGMLKVPMWYWQGELRRPSLEFMEAELAAHINRSLASCLADFEPLKKEYEIRELAGKGNWSIAVLIAERDIVLELLYPLEILKRAEAEKFAVERFATAIPVRLKRVYGLASDIFEALNSNLFIENMTIDLMALRPEDEVPFGGLEFGCAPKLWTVADIAAKVKEDVVLALPRIRFRNTDYEPFIADEDVYEEFRGLPRDPDTGEVKKLPKVPLPDDAYEYFHFLADVTDRDYGELLVDVIYMPSWPFELSARPSRGGVLRSGFVSGLGEILRFLCLQSWKFTYDVSFPVEIAIRDPVSFEGRGYTFKFAMPVLIKNNRGDRAPVTAIEFVVPEATPSICEPLSERKVAFVAKDGLYFEDLKDVRIGYRCFRFFCDLGATGADPVTKSYRLSTGLPVACSFGLITAKKEGYIEASEQYLGQDELTLYLTPLKKFSLDVVRVMSDTNRSEPLLVDEQALVTIKSDSYNLSAFALFPPVEGERAELELINGDADYKLEIALIRKNAWVGGFTGNWSVKVEEMLDKNHLTLKALEAVPTPTEPEEIAALQEAMKQPGYQALLRPEFGLREQGG